MNVGKGHDRPGAGVKNTMVSGFSFCRLSVRDIPEILVLLRSTWPVLYGATGSPDFSDQYLDWLYNGPDSEDHYLLGCRKDGVLVGFKGYLFRSMINLGEPLRAHIVTHLAIDPSLSFGERITVATEFGQMHTLIGVASDSEVPQGDIALAFFEEDKTISRSMERIARDAGLKSTYTTFQHAIINPRRVASAAANVTSFAVRSSVIDDIPSILQLLSRLESDGLSLRPSEEAFWHHSSMAPCGMSIVLEEHGAILGFLACYILSTIKEAEVSQVLIIETFAAHSVDALALLLHKAVEHSKECNVRGIVMENSTMISDEDCRHLGIVSTPRRMVLAVRSRTTEIEIGDSFFCDIK